MRVELSRRAWAGAKHQCEQLWHVVTIPKKVINQKKQNIKKTKNNNISNASETPKLRWLTPGTSIHCVHDNATAMWGKCMLPRFSCSQGTLSHKRPRAPKGWDHDMVPQRPTWQANRHIRVGQEAIFPLGMNQLLPVITCIVFKKPCQILYVSGQGGRPTIGASSPKSIRKIVQDSAGFSWCWCYLLLRQTLEKNQSCLDLFKQILQ